MPRWAICIGRLCATRGCSMHVRIRVSIISLCQSSTRLCRTIGIAIDSNGLDQGKSTMRAACATCMPDRCDVLHRKWCRTCRCVVKLLLRARVRGCGRLWGWICQLSDALSIHGGKVGSSYFACTQRHMLSMISHPPPSEALAVWTLMREWLQRAHTGWQSGMKHMPQRRHVGM